MPHIKDVAGSNYAFISGAANGQTIVVMCAIDNLVKGAAGGAMQWLNRVFGFEETTGLTRRRQAGPETSSITSNDRFMQITNTDASLPIIWRRCSRSFRSKWSTREGVYLHTPDGRKVLDLYGGHAVAALGYGHPRWVEALAHAGAHAVLPEQCRAARRAPARRDEAREVLRARARHDLLRQLRRGSERERAEARLQDDRRHARSSRSKAAFTAAPPPRAQSPGARRRSGTAFPASRST